MIPQGMAEEKPKKIDRQKIFKGEPVEEAYNPKGITAARGKKPPKEDTS